MLAAASSAARSSSRGRRAVALVVVLAIAGAALVATRLDSSADERTFSSDGARAAQATDELHERFGDEPIQILVKGNRDQGRLPALLLTEDLRRILGLEGCVSGNRPRRGKAPAPVCERFARERPVQVVYGPGTFINESARQIAVRFNAERATGRSEAEKAARAARKLAAAQGRSQQQQDRLAAQARQLALAQSFSDALGLALRYGLSRVPQLNDPDFVLKLVFEPSLGFATPKPRFSYLFPSSETALIQARLRPGLSVEERRRAVDLVREAVESRPFRLERGRYIVSGAPVVEDAVASNLSDQLWLLFGASLGLAGLALVAATRRASALVVLLPGLAGSALAFGVLSLAGGSLTIAAVAALPFVIALSAAAVVLLGPAGRHRPPAAGVAAGVALIGVLTFLLSPVSMVRTFAAIVGLGVVAALALWRAVGLSAPDLKRPPAIRARLLRRPADRLAAVGRRLLDIACTRPRRVLLVATVLAAAGWVLSTQTDVVTTPQRLASKGAQQVEDAATFERATGSAGEVSVIVRSERLTSRRVLDWMSRYQRRVLARHGYREDRFCQAAELCPGLSPVGLLGAARRPAEVRAELRRLPPYFSRAVISRDRRAANMSFRINSASAEDHQRLFDDMRAQLDPPAGVEARLAGSPVLAADSSGSLRTSWLALTAVGLAAALVLLLVAFRRSRDALVPLLPVALATGWSALVLFALQIPLNPLSAALAGIVIGTGGALSVVLSASYRAERGRGAAHREAIGAALVATRGRLVVAGVVALVAPLALLFSDVRMLRETGIQSLIDLAIVLPAIGVVLPASLVWAEERRPLPLPRTREERIALARRLAKRLRAVPGAARAGARALPGALRAVVPRARRRLRSLRESRRRNGRGHGGRRRGLRRKPRSARRREGPMSPE